MLRVLCARRGGARSRGRVSRRDRRGRSRHGPTRSLHRATAPRRSTPRALPDPRPFEIASSWLASSMLSVGVATRRCRRSPASIRRALCCRCRSPRRWSSMRRSGAVVSTSGRSRASASRISRPTSRGLPSERSCPIPGITRSSFASHTGACVVRRVGALPRTLAVRCARPQGSFAAVRTGRGGRHARVPVSGTATSR